MTDLQHSAPASLPRNGVDAGPTETVFWRAEGSLLNLTAVRPAGFFAWNAQTFTERWARRGAMGVLAVARPFLYCVHRVFATRVLHTVLRGVSQDRLDLLGEEYFEYVLKPRLYQRGVAKLKEVMAAGQNIVLVSQGLDHIMRPLAAHLGISHIVANRLEFRDGLATGRLIEPIIRPRGAFAKLTGTKPDGRISAERLARQLGFAAHPERLTDAVRPARRAVNNPRLPVVHYPAAELSSPNGSGNRPGDVLRGEEFRQTWSAEIHQTLPVRAAMRGKHILLIGATGFIGKVWLANLLMDLPDEVRITLLIRRTRSTTGWGRFQRIVEQSPVFEPLAERQGARLAGFLRERIQVMEGNMEQPDMGLRPEERQPLADTVDLIVNSSGLTDFNPDLRDALSANVYATTTLLDFLATCRHAALLHLSTSYVVGHRDGRVLETLQPNYVPVNVPGFDAEGELRSLEAMIKDTEARAEMGDVTDELRAQSIGKHGAAKDLQGAALEIQIRKNRVRWLRRELTEAGSRRAQELGWPNTYTLTKGIAESLIQNFSAAHPKVRIAVVRPSIVESSVHKPFLGWNEGINTSASLSYLLGTYFRQLPTNARKNLDLIPVDLVTTGMTLIAAALLNGRNDRVYHLATSVSNPCDMRRSIELTGLGHRRFYRAQPEFRQRLRLKFDAIPVSKARYEKLSAPAQKAIIQAISRSIEPLQFGKSALVRRERELDRVIKLVSLFEPFILHNNHTFEAAGVERLSAALPEEERAAFGYDARSIDWWDYWINVHIPALRKWCYPLIEGRPLEERPARHVPLEASTTAANSSGD
jgi:long-chain acyl-CoA synthetase